MYAPFHAKNPLKGHVVLVDLGANWSVPWNPFHSFQIKYPLSRVLIGSLFLRFVLYLLYSVVQSSGSHFWRRSGSLHQAFPSLGNIRAFDHIGILEVRMLNKWVGNSEKIVPLHLLYRTIAPLNRTIAPPTSYHCTAYIAPLYPSYCTSCTWCTCITVPLRCLHYTIVPALRTPVPALRTPWKPSSYLPPDYLSEQYFWNLIII